MRSADRAGRCQSIASAPFRGFSKVRIEHSRLTCAGVTYVQLSASKWLQAAALSVSSCRREDVQAAVTVRRADGSLTAMSLAHCKQCGDSEMS